MKPDTRTLGDVIDKIDELSANFERLMTEIQPVLDAYRTADNAGKFIVWFSKIIVAVGVIVAGVLALKRYF